MQLAELAGRRLAVWGAGREGRAAWCWLRRQLPAQPIALLCPPLEAPAARAFIDADTELVAAPIDLDQLRRFDIVVKSPGISAHRAPVPEAAAAGVRFTSGSALWFQRHAQARVVGITGSKGKSSTTAMVAHLLRAAGRRVVLAGNIGLPLLELPDDTTADWWVLELSSFQTCDLAAVPEIAVVLNLFPEHLDWHGSLERYYADKLRLLAHDGRHPRVSVLNALQDWPAGALPPNGVCWFGAAAGFHVDEAAIRRGGQHVLALDALPLPGVHNALNLCAALAAVEACGEDAIALAPSITSFKPLPHRLQPLGLRDGVEWVNDSIATTPHATLAALAHYRGRSIAVLVGGHDRGVPWDEFARAVAQQPPRAIVTLGMAGPRIAAALAGLDPACTTVLAARDLPDAIAQARALLSPGGVLLLSPGAPSFGEFRDYIERGRRFAALGGFDPELISHIEGLGP